MESAFDRLIATWISSVAMALQSNSRSGVAVAGSHCGWSKFRGSAW